MAGWRVTIFNEARERLKIKQGDFVIVRLEEGTLRIIPAEVKPKQPMPSPPVSLRPAFTPKQKKGN
jgi:bifunctional DNA-binding transcriptional regulator/antitoxin component of YhaV-PrlF toxin-antitoxin module